MSEFSGNAVTFEAGTKVFGLAIERVREIVHPSEISVTEETSMELRGSVLPLRRLATDPGSSARVLVVQGTTGTYGLLVDRVRGLLTGRPADELVLPYAD